MEAGLYDEVDTSMAGDAKWQRNLFWALFIANWIFARTIKLVPHLLRNPGDVRFIPVSILFGYFHNLIKLYGCITVTEVCYLPRIQLASAIADYSLSDHLGYPRRCRCR